MMTQRTGHVSEIKNWYAQEAMTNCEVNPGFIIPVALKWISPDLQMLNARRNECIPFRKRMSVNT